MIKRVNFGPLAGKELTISFSPHGKISLPREEMVKAYRTLVPWCEKTFGPSGWPESTGAKWNWVVSAHRGESGITSIDFGFRSPVCWLIFTQQWFPEQYASEFQFDDFTDDANKPTEFYVGYQDREAVYHWCFEQFGKPNGVRWECNKYHYGGGGTWENSHPSSHGIVSFADKNDATMLLLRWE